MSDLRAMMKQIDGWAIQPTKYFMSQSDYDDILAWSKEDK